jgi:hypothetical protein
MTDTEVRTGPAPRPAWQQCPSCGDLVYGPRLARNLQVCPGCGYHHRLTGQERIGQLFDPGCFEPLPGTGAPADLLGFTDTMSYPDRLAGAQEATGLAEAVLSGHGRISGRPAVAAVMDFWTSSFRPAARSPGWTPRVRRLPASPALRFAAGQGHRLGAGPGPGPGPHGARAGRVPDQRPRGAHHHRVPGRGSGRPRVPRRPARHGYRDPAHRPGGRLAGAGAVGAAAG